VAEVGSLVVYGASGGPNAGHNSAWLNWKDGGFVSGSLVSVTDGTALIQTPYSKEPLRCRMNALVSMGLARSGSGPDAELDMSHLSKQDALDLESLRRMKQALHRREAQLDAGDPAAKEIKEAIQRIDSDIADFAREHDPSIPNQTSDVLRRQPDRLFHTHGTLQGRLVVEGAADAPIQWTPLGGLNASTLQGVENARFVRASDVMHLSEHPELLAEFPDVVYLRNNDALPCRIEVCTEDGVQLTSPLTEVRAFTRDHIRAIELSAAGRIHQRGFDAKGWQGFPNRQKDTNRTKLEFVGNVHYSHPDILTGDTVRFRLEWPKQSWSSLTVSMFGTGQRNDTDCTHVCFGLMPSQIQILDRPMPQNQMMMGMRMGGRPGGNANDGVVAISDSQADIQILANDGNIIVSIDGQPAKTIKMNASSPGRRGIAFNGNVTAVGRVIVNGQVAQRAGEGVTLSNFEVDNLSGASIRQFIEEESRQAALTIPRFRRDNPPTHVLIAPNGDLLRGRLLAIEGDTVVFESRLETLRFDRSRVGAVVWLDAPEKDVVKSVDTGQEAEAATSSVATATAGDAEGFAADDHSEPTMQAQLADGFSITMKPLRLVDGRIEGSSALLGQCSFPARAVRELCTGNPEHSHRLAAYDTWVAKMAREPDWDIPQSDGGTSAASALIGTTAAEFELPMLDGTTFKLSDHQDKIVVLDFWATWCGPCVMALPDYIAATSKFDESKVLFVAVNLQESSDQIRSFLTEKQLSPHVALDRSAAVAPAFQVSGIPHTVILGPGNVIEDVHVGYQPGSGETMQTTIQQLLDGTWKRSVEVEHVE
jgi:thiol-disulfide isomerase/thioredoxin